MINLNENIIYRDGRNRSIWKVVHRPVKTTQTCYVRVVRARTLLSKSFLRSTVNFNNTLQLTHQHRDYLGQTCYDSNAFCLSRDGLQCQKLVQVVLGQCGRTVTASWNGAHRFRTCTDTCQMHHSHLYSTGRNTNLVAAHTPEALRSFVETRILLLFSFLRGGNIISQNIFSCHLIS